MSNRLRTHWVKKNWFLCLKTPQWVLYAGMFKLTKKKHKKQDFPNLLAYRNSFGKIFWGTRILRSTLWENATGKLYKIQNNWQFLNIFVCILYTQVSSDILVMCLDYVLLKSLFYNDISILLLQSHNSNNIRAHSKAEHK